MYGKIIHRIEDDSFVINSDSMPYHVLNEGEFSELWQKVKAYAEENPEDITEEEPIKPYEPTSEEIEAQALEQAKSERADAVSKILVTVDGLIFDGDEMSQQRMSRSIVALEDGETMPWVLYDNTVTQVTKEQLKQALRLAGIKQSELWVLPYTNT